jgi:N utilization substance protein B
MSQNNTKNVRVKIIQKLYGSMLNPGEIIEYPKSQYKKFIKDVVQGTIERNELITETIQKYLLNDIDLKKSDKLLKIIIFSAIFELMFKHNNPKKVIISEYLKASEYFLEKGQIRYLNAILDKVANNIRNDNIRK